MSRPRTARHSIRLRLCPEQPWMTARQPGWEWVRPAAWVGVGVGEGAASVGVGAGAGSAVGGAVASACAGAAGDATGVSEPQAMTSRAAKTSSRQKALFIRGPM